MNMLMKYWRIADVTYLSNSA